MPLAEISPGMRLYYEDFGDGDPVVFICGGHLTHKVWESQVAALAGEFRTVTFDWRGTGSPTSRAADTRSTLPRKMSVC